MRINADGTINNDIKGVILKDMNLILGSDQFFQWTPTGKRLELWDGKSDYESDGVKLRKVAGWNRDSVIGFIQD